MILFITKGIIGLLLLFWGIAMLVGGKKASHVSDKMYTILALTFSLPLIVGGGLLLLGI